MGDRKVVGRKGLSGKIPRTPRTPRRIATLCAGVRERVRMARVTSMLMYGDSGDSVIFLIYLIESKRE
jgi:hypothetical protein